MSRYLAVPSFDGPSDTRSRSGSQNSAGSHSRHPSQGGASHVSGSHVSGSHVSASQGGGSRAGGSSRPPSNVGAASGPQGYPQPLGYDPGRDEPTESPEEIHRKQVGKRVDLPPEAFVEVSCSVEKCDQPFTLHADFLNSKVLDTPSQSDAASARAVNQSPLGSTSSVSLACLIMTSTSTM